jgi:SynChlorMet cassette radical SAM/SPASM protein ScmF
VSPVARPSKEKAPSPAATPSGPPPEGPVAAETPADFPFPLHTLYFYLTEGCNLACRHCWIAPKFQSGAKVYPSLPFDMLKDIVRQAKPLGLGSVKLTGGEPLMHPDIFAILAFLRDEGLGVTIETNGLLCTPELAREIAQCKGRFVSVSLDGADAETNEWVRGVPGSFAAAVAGIKNLVAAGVHPQVIMTVMRKNRHQVEDIVRLAESIGASSVKYNVMMPCARGEEMHKRGEALTMEELVELGRWVETDLAPRTKLRLVFHHPPAFRPLGKMYGEEGDGCSRCGIFGILGVLSDGSYALCGIGEQVPELVFGHASRDRLEDVWKNEPVLKQIREGLPKKLKGVCGECMMKGLCLGSCVAQNYYSSRELFAPFWYCEEALRLGLFPTSRLLKRDAR